MQLPSVLLENAVNEFAKLPGIGKKTALRMVLHLLKQDINIVQQFGDAISRMRKEIRFCQRCHNVADADICSICANSMRRHDMICVVETIRDVIAIESTQQFSGTYHVLGGIISPLDGIGPEQLFIESLIDRVQKEGVTEIIFALNPNIQGDTTIYYIQKKLAPFQVKVTTIARGSSRAAEKNRIWLALPTNFRREKINARQLCTESSPNPTQNQGIKGGNTKPKEFLWACIVI